jgi:outer membrane biosynthesis protein TonB
MFSMNGYPEIGSVERWQSRWIRRMMFLSILFHGGMLLLGSTVSSLFPSYAIPPVVIVELTETPLSTLSEEPDSPPPVLRASGAAPGHRQKGEPPPSQPRWLKKLDAGLAKLSDAPVARKTGKTGGLAVRQWENSAAPKPGDFAPEIAPQNPSAAANQLRDLEGRVRRSGGPYVGSGTESAATAMFGGVGASAGEPIPPWIRDMIRKKVHGYLPELEAAYSASLRRNPNLKGKLMVRFRIDPAGKIQRADPVESTIRDEDFVAVVLEKIRHWTFDPPGGHTVEVLYPFVFVAPA